MTIKDDIQKIIKGEVLDDTSSLKKAAKDASIFEITPQIVVYPKDTEDIKKIVRFVNEHQQNGVSITVRSAGTDMSGGAIGDSIVMDMTKYFNQIIKINDSSVIIQPGVYYRDLETVTVEKGLIFPSYPASKALCTVGGIVANNAGGEMTLKYGQTQKYVKRLKVVLSDGEEYEFRKVTSKEIASISKEGGLLGNIYTQMDSLLEENTDLITRAQPKTHKNSNGYNLWNTKVDGNMDLCAIFTGSQGTLGIITEIELELVKIDPHKALLVIELDHPNELDKIVSAILEYKPEAFEFYDDQTLSYAIKFISDLKNSFKLNTPDEAAKYFSSLRLKQFLGMLPKLTLLAEFTALDDQRVQEIANQALKSLQTLSAKVQVITDAKIAERFWIVRHESFRMLKSHSQQMTSAPFIDDIIVRPEKLPEFLPKLNQIIQKYAQNLGRKKFIYTVAGHIGDGNFHIIPLIDLDDQEVRGAIPQIMDEVFNLTFEFEGSMSAEHNDGLIRGMYLPKMYGEDVFQLFKQVKEIFDPNNIFNPHKKTEATYEYSFKHLSSKLHS